MNLIAPSSVLVQQLAGAMRERQEDLRALLHAANGAAANAEAPGEVLDFKDVAAEDSRAMVDDAARAHAVDELEQIAGALRRIELGTYGQCEDCGEVIDERRLRALPATRFCTACQAIHERPVPRR